MQLDHRKRIDTQNVENYLDGSLFTVERHLYVLMIRLTLTLQHNHVNENNSRLVNKKTKIYF